MTANPEEANPATPGKHEHLVFHADEELEWDARLAELSGIDAHAAKQAALESHLPQSADRMAVTFGILGSI